LNFTFNLFINLGPMIKRNKWYQITVTADTEIGEAKIVINGGTQSIGLSLIILTKNYEFIPNKPSRHADVRTMSFLPF